MRTCNPKLLHRARRRAAVLPLVALLIIGLFGFLALAIDLGMIAVARTQAQNMADSSATAGARTLNGEYLSSTDDTQNNNYQQVDDNAKAVAGQNKILGEAIDQNNDITIQIGSYTYYESYTDPTTGTVYTKQFVPRYPQKDPSSNWSLVRVTITASRDYAFARALGLTEFDVTATAMAAHRPRDVAIILDLTGTMRYASLSGVSHSGARASGNNPDPIYPKYGHYSSGSAGMQRTTELTSGNYKYDLANFTRDAADDQDTRPPVVLDYYQHVRGAATKVVAFTKAGDGDSEGFMSGSDKPQKGNDNSSGQPYAQDVAQIKNLSASLGNGHAVNASWEATGYTSSFKGYTQGPRYYGKTFYIWPPDPHLPIGDHASSTGYIAGDWRKRFFLKTDGTTPVDDNSLLWDSSGNWRSPSVAGTDYYRINYAAILHWLINTGPTGAVNPFPNRLQAGRILYYDAIPNPATDANLNAKMWGTGSYSWPPTDQNYRFWKDYIDYVLGVKQINASGTYKWDANVPSNTSVDLDGSGSMPSFNIGANTLPNILAYTGYGDNFSWGTPKITPLSSLTAIPRPYMHYNDKPLRPRLQFWFGAMTMADFLGNHNLANRYDRRQHYWWPGTGREYPTYPCKAGIKAALLDIERNHPNDHVTLIMFSEPKETAGDYTGRRFNRVSAPLGRNYQRMIDALYFPPYTLDNPTVDVRPYEHDRNIEAPRALGATCFSMPLMLAFNQFSINSSCRTFNPSPAPTGDAGGLGRKGAQKLVIFETDGLPNVMGTKSLTSSSTAHNSYYPIRYNSTTPSSSEFPSVSGQLAENDSTVVAEIEAVCTQLAASESSYGYSTTNKPVLIHTIGFGPVFESGHPLRSGSLDTLNKMEIKGNIPVAQRINSTTAPYGTTAAPYKLITGNESNMITGLRNCITNIMQDGIQVSLLE